MLKKNDAKNNNKLKDGISKISLFPQNYLIFFILIMMGLDYLFPFYRVDSDILFVFAYVFIVLGFFLNIWTKNIFQDLRNSVKINQKPNNLVVDGPFALSRNPMYLGMLFILIGIACLLKSIICILPIFVFGALININFIYFEEKFLEDIFGVTYSKYRKQVNKWL